MTTLNLGCGNDLTGDVRVDFSKESRGANKILNLELPLPFEDNSFSKVIAKGIIEHLPNPVQFISEIYRVMEPNASLLLVTDNAAFPLIYWKGQRHAGGYRGRVKNDKHYMVFHPSHILEIFSRVGFVEIKIELVPYREEGAIVGKATNVIQRIGEFLSKLGISENITQYLIPIIQVSSKKPMKL